MTNDEGARTGRMTN